MSAWTWAALGYALASRLAYVLWVGAALTGQERRGAFTRRWGVEEGFRRFRHTADLLMRNDAVAFVVVSLAGWNTLHLGGGLRVVAIAAGIVLIVVGVGIKVWAALVVGSKTFYWYDFFSPVLNPPTTAGPYRVLKNPMYTVGYVQTYGVALVTASIPGLISAAFDHAAILAFYWTVEKPHFDRVHGSGDTRRARDRRDLPADTASQ
jgi:protein-S-isoprenylcysteine O-methyltransferase Ste14